LLVLNQANDLNCPDNQLTYVGAIQGPVYFNSQATNDCVEIPKPSNGKNKNCTKRNQVCSGTVLEFGQTHVAFGYHCSDNDNFRYSTVGVNLFLDNACTTSLGQGRI